MLRNTLFSISPVDGRYYAKTEILSAYFSEFALMQYRVRIEIEYFIALCEAKIPPLSPLSEAQCAYLRNIYHNFSEKDAEQIKTIENTTQHDVKAVEYFIKGFFHNTDLAKYTEFVHFGLTSQDINNTAVPLSLKEGLENGYFPLLSTFITRLQTQSETWAQVPMLAHTHGQAASPTTVGKEFSVFVLRLQEQLSLLQHIPFAAKFGGATGNFNAHYVAYPQIDWLTFAENFVEKKLGLYRSKITTQIEHYDHLAALLHNLARINTILIDLCRDIWTYISMDYFKQKIKAGEVGSSAMPHKVNPIDFENAEGNLGIANALMNFMAEKLPVSRLQRDLTDSTVLRNLGVPLAHTLIALQSLQKGLDKLLLNETAIREDLENNWVVVAEALQTILRREQYPQAYELLKDLSRRNNKLQKEDFVAFIDALSVSDAVKEEMKKITPFNYTGIYR
ncbi:MAG: adenylosuccinate lyase [Chitinophagales bacterium]|nr:adenylosuccinate lyase [Bacteroidota bacterium]MCB9043950.1 adenylosuccinate lyase [Chitinophagales bacterium]